MTTLFRYIILTLSRVHQDEGLEKDTITRETNEQRRGVCLPPSAARKVVLRWTGRWQAHPPTLFLSRFN